MNSGVLHQKVRTRRPGSDSTSAVASAAGTTKVDPRYGDTAAVGAQQVIGAAADELDHGGRLRSRVDIGLRSRLGIELVAGREDGWRRDIVRAGMDTEAGSGTRSIAVDDGVDVLTRCYLVARAAPSCRYCSIPCRRDERKQSQ